MSTVWTHFTVVVISNLVVFLLLGLAFISNYNSLTQLGEKLREGWGQIEAHLQLRYDALFSMSQVVQGYAGHEQAIDAVVAKAQTAICESGGIGERVQKSAEAEHVISGFLGHVVHIATSFPELKADSHFQELLRTIQDTGNAVTQRRESYNNMVSSYNAFLMKYPTRFYAMYLGFSKASYFSFGDAVRAELPEMMFSQRAVVDGALAGSPRFPPDSAPPALPNQQSQSQLGTAIEQEESASPGKNIPPPGGDDGPRPSPPA